MTAAEIQIYGQNDGTGIDKHKWLEEANVAVAHCRNIPVKSVTLNEEGEKYLGSSVSLQAGSIFIVVVVRASLYSIFQTNRRAHHPGTHIPKPTTPRISDVDVVVIRHFYCSAAFICTQITCWVPDAASGFSSSFLFFSSLSPFHDF